MPTVLAPSDYDDGEIGEMMISRGDRSTRRKPAPVSLCPPQKLCPDANPSRRGGKPATNRLSYGTIKGANKSLTFPISYFPVCSTTIKEFFLDGLKKLEQRKS
jgi:hypothetical protein